MKVSVRNGERLSLEQIRAFLEGSDEIEFEAAHREEVYDWVTRLLCEQEYWKQKRGTRGILRRLHRQNDGAEPCASDATG